MRGVVDGDVRMEMKSEMGPIPRERRRIYKSLEADIEQILPIKSTGGEHQGLGQVVQEICEIRLEVGHGLSARDIKIVRQVILHRPDHERLVDLCHIHDIVVVQVHRVQGLLRSDLAVHIGVDRGHVALINSRNRRFALGGVVPVHIDRQNIARARRVKIRRVDGAVMIDVVSGLQQARDRLIKARPPDNPGNLVAQRQQALAQRRGEPVRRDAPGREQQPRLELFERKFLMQALAEAAAHHFVLRAGKMVSKPALIAALSCVHRVLCFSGKLFRPRASGGN